MIRQGAEEWRRANDLMDSVTDLAEWLEDDMPGRFAEMLDTILERLPSLNTQKEEKDDE